MKTHPLAGTTGETTTELRPIYSLRELAAMAGMKPRKLRGILLAAEVTLLRGGPRTAYVLMAELRARVPQLWESLVGKAACEAARRVIAGVNAE